MAHGIYIAEERILTGGYGEDSEPLYCGEVIHPFVMTLKEYKSGSLTLQEALTSLLLQSQGESIILYKLEDVLNDMFGEGSAKAVNDKYLESYHKTVHSHPVKTYPDKGLGFWVSK